MREPRPERSLPAAPSRPPCRTFDHEVELRPSDRDTAGHLNHVATVALFEHARVKAHADVRAEHPELPDMATAVRRLEVDYHAQAPPFARLVVRSWVLRDGGSSRTWRQELVRDDGTLVARARVVSVLVSSEGRPQRLPDVYRELFAAWTAPEEEAS